MKRFFRFNLAKFQLEFLNNFYCSAQKQNGRRWGNLFATQDGWFAHSFVRENVFGSVSKFPELRIYRTVASKRARPGLVSIHNWKFRSLNWFANSFWFLHEPSKWYSPESSLQKLRDSFVGVFKNTFRIIFNSSFAQRDRTCSVSRFISCTRNSAAVWITVLVGGGNCED